MFLKTDMGGWTWHWIQRFKGQRNRITTRASNIITSVSVHTIIVPFYTKVAFSELVISTHNSYKYDGTNNKGWNKKYDLDYLELLFSDTRPGI